MRCHPRDYNYHSHDTFIHGQYRRPFWGSPRQQQSLGWAKLCHQFASKLETRLARRSAYTKPPIRLPHSVWYALRWVVVVIAVASLGKTNVTSGHAVLPCWLVGPYTNMCQHCRCFSLTPGTVVFAKHCCGVRLLAIRRAQSSKLLVLS